MNKCKMYIACILLTMLVTSLALAEDGEYDDFATKSLLVKGKILDRHSQLVQGPVKLKAYIGLYKGEDPDSKDPDVIIDVTEEEMTTSDGTFSWQFGKVTTINILPIKDGYYSFDSGYRYDFETSDVVIEDMFLYLVRKGEPVDLEWTNHAYISLVKDATPGWSFKRRWSFPADNYDVLMKCYLGDEKGDVVLEMKAGGGFIKFDGYPSFESKPDDKWASFEQMLYAPEMGYEQKITFTPEMRREMLAGKGGYYYFRTPDGKYGKMKFYGYGKGMCNFSYYLNPTGSRSLELREKIYRSPRNPKTLYPMPDD